MGGTHCTIQRQQMDKKSDRVDTTRMDKTTWKTLNKMERQPYPPPGSCMAKNSQRPASVETVQGGVPPYGVKETLVVVGNGKRVSLAMVGPTLNRISTDLVEKVNFVVFASKHMGTVAGEAC